LWIIGNPCEWLKNCARRLSANTLEVTHQRFTYGGSLLQDFCRDDDTGRYVLILIPKMVVIFGRSKSKSGLLGKRDMRPWGRPLRKAVERPRTSWPLHNCTEVRKTQPRRF
jgi:hypothetical protein